jgi:hypothetical protein
MKKIDVLATAILFLLPGAIAPVYAQGREQEKQPEQKQQQQAKPAQKQQQAKPAAQAQHAQKQQQAKPAAQAQHAQKQQQAKPAAQPQRAQKQQQAKPAAQHQQASRAKPAGAHGSIPDAKFRASFGSGHTFHVNRSEFAGGARRFQYGGYWFGLVEPWPVGWLYTDSVYVDFLNGGYVLCDPVHPGVYLSINIG